MKNNHIKIILSIILLATMITSCNKHDEHKYHTITDKIEAESVHPDSVHVSSDRFHEGIDTMSVTVEGHTFLIPKRKEHLKSYKCSDCHTKPIEQLKGKNGQRAHWDIKLNHANENTMNCATCHNTNNPDDLHSLTGNTIDFNNSYNLCSQCHSKQYQDWAGGAHGKKVGGWAPPRVSFTCVNCHNPHSPSFEPRWPSRFNTEKEIERK